MPDMRDAKPAGAPAEQVPLFTLRADDPRHLRVLIAALRAAEQQFGARDAFTLAIAAAVRAFEVYDETHGRSGSGGRRPAEGGHWPRF